MMNNIIVFNDLPLFYKNVARFNDKLKNVFSKLQNITRATFISFEEAKNWFGNLDLDCNNICLGTRPKMLIKKPFVNVITIREKQSNGIDKSVEILNKSKKDLKVFLKDKSNISIIEDAIVEGKTMNEILNFILGMNKNISIKICSLICSENYKKLIQQNYKNVVITNEYFLYGQPIKDCTALFLYDLINNKLNNKLFIENEDLLIPCFGKEYENIKNELLKIKYELLGGKHE